MSLFPQPLLLSRALALGVICVTLIVTGFVSNNTFAADIKYAKIKGEILWQSGYEYVSIVARDSDPRSHHPTRVSAKSLQRALRNIQIKRSAGFLSNTSKHRPLFSEDAANKLGKYLAVALRRANRDQDILFRVGDVHTYLGSIIERNLYTAGRVFWYKKRLHIIFGGIHNTVKQRMVYGQPGKLIGEPEDGSRDSETELEFEIVTAAGVTYALKNRRDWIAVSPSRVRPPAATGKPSERGDIKTRMQKLKRLRDEGLIDEREYRARKRELLDEL